MLYKNIDVVDLFGSNGTAQKEEKISLKEFLEDMENMEMDRQVLNDIFRFNQVNRYKED